MGISASTFRRTLWPLSLVEGDSESAGGMNTSWVTYIQSLPASSRASWTNHALDGGRTLQQIVDSYATAIAPFAPRVTGIPCGLDVWAGSNDIMFSGNTGAEVAALSQTLATMAVADQFVSTFFTCLPRLNQTAFNAQAAIYNALAKAQVGWQMIYDAATAFPDPNTYIDGIHLTSAQEQTLAGQLNTQSINTFYWQ